MLWQKSAKLLVALTLLTGGSLLAGGRASATSVFESGAGTEADPYVIVTPDQLNQLRNYPSADFVLNADIDLSTSSYASGWTPISSFGGTLNGQGHTISGLRVVGAGTFVGMFATTSATALIGDLTIRDSLVTNGTNNTTAVLAAKNEGKITAVTIVDSSVSGNAFTGMLVGANTGDLSYNQIIGGLVTGGQDSGGLLGINSGTVEYSRVYNTEVTGSTGGTGGLVGDNQAAGGVIEWSAYVSDTAGVTGAASIGGLVGENGGQIHSSYVSGTVGSAGSGSIVGGLTGSNSGTVQDSYAVGAVWGSSTVGGLVGLQMSEGKLLRSYVNATLSPTAGTGGSGSIVGQAAGEISGVFWNLAKSGTPAYGSGTPSGSGASGLSSEQMVQGAGFTAALWDFDDIWQIDEGVSAPELRSLLRDVSLAVNGDVVPLYFFPQRRSYTVHVASGTAAIAVTATPALDSDSVSINGGAAGVMSTTVTLTSDPQTIPVIVTRGEETQTYSVRIQGSGSTIPTVDRSGLATVLGQAGDALTQAVVGSGEGEYDASAVSMLMGAFNAATAVYAQPDATQSDIDVATTALSAAVAAFETQAVAVDRSGLNAALAAANAVVSGATIGTGTGEYAPEAAAALGAVIVNAAMVYAQPDVTQSELDAATVSLNAAVTVFQGSALLLDGSALAAALSTAGGLLVSAEEGSGPGRYDAADLAALAADVTAASTVYLQADVTQGELDAATTALNGAVAAFRSAMHGASLVFAEEMIDGNKHVLVLTYNHSLQAVSSASAFTLSVGGIAITGAQTDPGDAGKVRLYLSDALPSTGSVTVTAGSSAVVLSGGADNTAASTVYVLPAGAADQLRQALLGSGVSPDSRIDMGGIAQYMQQQFATADKHGIGERALIQFCLQQIAPLFLTNGPAGA